MATKAYQAINRIPALAARIETNYARLVQTQQHAANAANDLEAMRTDPEILALISDVNQAAAANPTNATLQQWKTTLSMLKSEYEAMLTPAQQMENAVKGISF